MEVVLLFLVLFGIAYAIANRRGKEVHRGVTALGVQSFPAGQIHEELTGRLPARTEGRQRNPERTGAVCLAQPFRRFVLGIPDPDDRVVRCDSPAVLRSCCAARDALHAHHIAHAESTRHEHETGGLDADVVSPQSRGTFDDQRHPQLRSRRRLKHEIGDLRDGPDGRAAEVRVREEIAADDAATDVVEQDALERIEAVDEVVLVLDETAKKLWS